MTTASPRFTVALEPVHDMDAKAWAATLSFSEDDRAPVVTLHSLQPYKERYSYLLCTMLDAAADGRGFNFGNFGGDATMHRFSPVALSSLAALARKRVPGTAGRFEVVWVPTDPEVPF